jgi:hypothetical protein
VLWNRQGKKAEAKQVTKEWAQNVPNEVQSQMEYGLMLLEEKDYADAVGAFLQAHRYILHIIPHFDRLHVCRCCNQILWLMMNRLQPDFQTSYNLALCHIGLQDVEHVTPSVIIIDC